MGDAGCFGDPLMSSRTLLAAFGAVGLAVCLALPGTFAQQGPQPLTAEVRQQLERDLKELGERLAELRTTKAGPLADAEGFHKGLVWALRYDTQFDPAGVALLQKALVRGKQRVEALKSGKSPWTERK